MKTLATTPRGRVRIALGVTILFALLMPHAASGAERPADLAIVAATSTAERGGQAALLEKVVFVERPTLTLGYYAAGGWTTSLLFTNNTAEVQRIDSLPSGGVIGFPGRFVDLAPGGSLSLPVSREGGGVLRIASVPTGLRIQSEIVAPNGSPFRIGPLKPFAARRIAHLKSTLPYRSGVFLYSDGVAGAAATVTTRVAGGSIVDQFTIPAGTAVLKPVAGGGVGGDQIEILNYWPGLSESNADLYGFVWVVHDLTGSVMGIEE
jgi:hypothetical protein